MPEKAPDSPQIHRARKKLQQQLLEERKLFNPEKLKQVIARMRGWIHRHATERVSLKDKKIALFDENIHREKTHSKYVQQLRQQLKQNLSKKKNKSLQGRAKKPSSQQK